MILVNYLNECKNFRSNIRDISSHLTNKKEFPKEKRQALNEVLNQLVQFIAKKNLSQTQTDNANDLIQHLWTYQFLHQELETIKKAIQDITSQYFFTRKIGSQIQPILMSQIRALETAYMRIGRMPIHYGTSLSKLKGQVTNELSSNANSIDSSVFHLALDKCPETDLKTINTKSLEGSWELGGLLSWQEIIKQMPETATSKKVLTAFDYAIQIAQKTQLGCKVHDRWSKNGVKYYEAWADIANRLSQAALNQKQADLFDPTFLSQLSPVDRSAIETFKSQASVRKKFFMPQTAFTSDVAHDIERIIDGLKAGDFCFFSLGLSYHSIVVQITCVSPVNPHSLGDYTYRIFNTYQDKEANYHSVWPTMEGDYAEPWVITDLNRDVLSVEFFEQLVRYSTTKGYSEKDFYETHRQCLINKGKGVVSPVPFEERYPLQSKGVCVYASIEACLSVLLPSSEFKEAELIKFTLSVNKQSQAVLKRHYRKKHLKRGCLTNASLKKKRKSLLEKETAKLERSQKLLELAQKQLENTETSKDSGF